jgi:hypothetical protein
MRYKMIVSLLTLLVMLSGCADSGQQLSAAEIEQQKLLDIERGRHVVKTLGCNDCHTRDYMVTRGNIPEEDWLTGGALGFRNNLGTLYATNLRLLLNNLSEEDWLVLAMKMSEDSPMTWVMLPETPEQDLRAFYRFVKYLGPNGTPAIARLPAGEMPTTPYVDYPNPH